MKALLFLAFSAVAFAQPYFLGVKYTNADPAAPCTLRSILVANYTNGTVWVCNAGTYTNITGGGGGGGTVTSVSWTGGIVSIANPTTTPAFTLAGTSGGIPYFSSASTWASSALLTANLPVIGGGAGAAPTVGTRSGNTTEFATVTGSTPSGNCAKWDASGNVVDAGSPCGSSSGTVTSISTTSPITGGTITTTGTIACATCVTAASALTSNLPIFGAGSQATAVGTRSGNTTEVATVTGSTPSGNCAKWDANGNIVDNGSTCGVPGTTAPGTNTTLSGSYQIYFCTGTCTITVPVPSLNLQYCVANDDNVGTVITMAALGSSARYETTARTGYGTAGTGTMVSGGAVGDMVCIVGRDSTHYETTNYVGVWTVN